MHWLSWEPLCEPNFYVSVLRVASGPRVKLASCKSALTPPPPPPPPVVYSADRSKAVVPVLVLVFVALWFILRGDLFYVLPCVILLLCFSVLLALRLPRLGKTELILVIFCTFVRFVLVLICRFLSSWCLGRDAVCDCGTPWTFLLPFFLSAIFFIIRQFYAKTKKKVVGAQNLHFAFTRCHYQHLAATSQSLAVSY